MTHHNALLNQYVVGRASIDEKYVKNMHKQYACMKITTQFLVLHKKKINFTHKIFKFQDSNRYIKLLKRVSALPGHSSVTE